MLTPMALTDLAAILPSLLLIPGMDLRSLRIVRLIRLFRVAKLARYTDALEMIGKVLIEKKSELVVSIVIVLFMIILAASLIYVAEHDHQPDAFSSIPVTMWWAVTTLSTVGYGDMYPVTPIGRFLAGILAILGIGVFAVPTGILAAAFNDLARTRRDSRKRGEDKPVCPHCGRSLEAEGVGGDQVRSRVIFASTPCPLWPFPAETSIRAWFCATPRGRFFPAPSLDIRVAMR